MERTKVVMGNSLEIIFFFLVGNTSSLGNFPKI